MQELNVINDAIHSLIQTSKEEVIRVVSDTFSEFNIEEEKLVPIVQLINLKYDSEFQMIKDTLLKQYQAAKSERERLNVINSIFEEIMNRHKSLLVQIKYIIKKHLS